MRTYFFIFFTIFSISVKGQNTLDAEIITKSNDTLNKKIKIIIDPIGFVETRNITLILKVKIFDSSGSKQTLHSREISKISFVDYKGEKRIYISNEKNELAELMHSGKIRWTREYSTHPYDGSTIIFEVWTNEFGVMEDTYMFRNAKKALKRMVSAKPELIDLIDNTKFNKETIKNVLIKYDE
ncbi:MAG: hypothetical protein EAZ35_04065 [Sphingobacteriia bacterium]|nr:MAG: hypothetical protein EAZ35_04065 [Sphingobacteriia bacterium]